MKESIAVIAVTLNVIAYLVYFNQMNKDKSQPNPTTWGLWAFITLVDFLSYESLSGDLLTSGIFFIDFIACGAIFIYKLFKTRKLIVDFIAYYAIFIYKLFKTKKSTIDCIVCGAILICKLFKSVKPTLELTIIVFGVSAIYIWRCLENVEVANLMICVASTVASIPTLRDVWKNPKTESPPSWWLSTGAYSMMTTCVLIERDSSVEFVAPIVLMLVHAGVAILASKNKKQKNIFKK
jgi:hypothetical protein